VPERMLVVKVRRADQTRIELFTRHHKWPDLRCDVADLAGVLTDPAGLPVGEERAAAFWAIWDYSERVNTKGNRYKDLIAVEPISGPATATSAAVGDPEVVGLLRRIADVLSALATVQGVAMPAGEADQVSAEAGELESEALDAAFPRFGDGSAVPDAAVPFWQSFYQEKAKKPRDVEELRAWAKASKAKG